MNKPFTLWLNEVAPQLSPIKCPGMHQVRTKGGLHSAVCDSVTEIIFSDIKTNSGCGIYYPDLNSLIS